MKIFSAWKMIIGHFRDMKIMTGNGSQAISKNIFKKKLKIFAAWKMIIGHFRDMKILQIWALGNFATRKFCKFSESRGSQLERWLLTLFSQSVDISIQMHTICLSFHAACPSLQRQHQNPCFQFFCCLSTPLLVFHKVMEK